MSAYTSYHVLMRALGPAAAPQRLFADATRHAAHGFVQASDYHRRANLVERAAPSHGEIRRRMRELVATDLNPVCTLLATAPSPAAFEARWNGLHRLWRVATDTLVHFRGDGVIEYRRQVRDANARDTELKESVMAACLATLAHPPERASDWAGVGASLGMDGRAPCELAAWLQSRPDASLAEAATQLGCSARTLERQLMEAGTAFTQVRAAVRTTTAARLLREGDLPLTEIAQQAGFYDSAHFARGFRAATGTTPTQYRQLARCA